MRRCNHLSPTRSLSILGCCVPLLLACGGADGGPDSESVVPASNAVTLPCVVNKGASPDGTNQPVKSACALTHNADGTCTVVCPPKNGGAGGSGYSLESHNQSQRLGSNY